MKFRKSAKTRSWEKAEIRARELEQEIEAIEKAAAQGLTLKSGDDGLRTIEAAVERYIDDKKQQNCSDATITKVTTLFKKQFLGWTTSKGLTYVIEITLDHLEEFRKTWKDKSPLGRKKKQSSDQANRCQRSRHWM